MDIVKYLVDNGADCNAINKGGETPLLAARNKGQNEVAAYLEGLQ